MESIVKVFNQLNIDSVLSLNKQLNQTSNLESIVILDFKVKYNSNKR